MMLWGDVLLAYLVICLWEVLDKAKHMSDPGADQNLTTTDASYASSFSEYQGEGVSGLIHLLAWGVEASLAF